MTFHVVQANEKARSQYEMDNYRHAGRMGFSNMYGMNSNGVYTLMDLGSNTQPWNDLYLASDGQIFFGTQAKEVISKSDIYGYIRGINIAWKNSTTIYVRPGEIEVDGTLYTCAGFEYTPTGLTNSKIHSVYIDKSTITGSSITSSNLRVSTTRDWWSDSKIGRYEPPGLTTPTNVTGVTLYSPYGDADTYSLAYTNATNTLSWGGGTAFSINTANDFHDFTIDDGSGNSVRVHCDISALPGSDQSDNITLSYPDSASDRSIGWIAVNSSGDIMNFMYKSGWYVFLAENDLDPDVADLRVTLSAGTGDLDLSDWLPVGILDMRCRVSTTASGTESMWIDAYDLNTEVQSQFYVANRTSLDDDGYRMSLTTLIPVNAGGKLRANVSSGTGRLKVYGFKIFLDRE